MSKSKRVIITGWSALLRCNSCGEEHESSIYGNWSINSTTICRCPACNRTTNHTIIGRIAEMSSYEGTLPRLK